jgi:hypothetical protein
VGRWIGVPVVLQIALMAFWNWDWFKSPRTAATMSDRLNSFASTADGSTTERRARVHADGTGSAAEDLALRRRSKSILRVPHCGSTTA